MKRLNHETGWLLSLVVTWSSVAVSQTPQATLSGVVTDAQEAVVPDVCDLRYK